MKHLTNTTTPTKKAILAATEHYWADYTKEVMRPICDQAERATEKAEAAKKELVDQLVAYYAHDLVAETITLDEDAIMALAAEAQSKADEVTEAHQHNQVDLERYTETTNDICEAIGITTRNRVQEVAEIADYTRGFATIATQHAETAQEVAHILLDILKETNE